MSPVTYTTSDDELIVMFDKEPDMSSYLLDTYALCRDGKLPTVELLKLIHSLKEETDLTIWKAISRCLDHLDRMISYTETNAYFKIWANKVYLTIFKKIGWEPEDDEDEKKGILRGLITSRLVSLGNVEVLVIAQKLFKNQINGRKSISSHLKLVCYKAAAMYGDWFGKPALSPLIKIFRTTDMHEEKIRVLVALANIKDDKLLERSIRFAMSDEVRKEDRIYFFRALGLTNCDVSFDLLKKRKNVICDIYRNSPMMSRVVRSLTEHFVCHNRILEVSELFKEDLFSGAEEACEKTIEYIEINTAWLDRDLDAVDAYIWPRSEDALYLIVVNRLLIAHIHVSSAKKWRLSAVPKF